MIDAIAGIESTVAGRTFAGYQQSWPIRRAVERGIEIISEASRHIPEDLKERHPHIYWREIAAIGNLLRHEYGRIDDRIMWARRPKVPAGAENGGRRYPAIDRQQIT
jgi:uncharacterized protein with HEPN domain